MIFIKLLLYEVDLTYCVVKTLKAINIITVMLRRLHKGRLLFSLKYSIVQKCWTMLFQSIK